MKKTIVMALLSALGAATALAQETLYIGVQSAPLRANPAPFAPIVGKLSYGEAVIVLARQPGWLQVRSAGGISGWANQSLFQRERVTLTAGTTDARTGATAREQAAAAKGFSPQVESQYRNQNPDLSAAYEIIDRMEASRLPDSEVEAFLKKGGLL
ncbi:MAG: SH3 domain-containing protein [Kiritimatiellae bacterium]|nr:SH3 domain-containing protein [Kiritimatiellia bacterium]MDW8459160.1 SH3 domain-containing protein [Verrucomicrobiota bacterium]